MGSDIGEVPSEGAPVEACDAPVAGGGGGTAPPARAEALDRRPVAGWRAGGEVMVAPDPCHGRREGAGRNDVPGQPAGPHREQHALQQGEERPDPEAEERHLSR